MEIKQVKQHMLDYLRIHPDAVDPDPDFADILSLAAGISGMAERQLATTFFYELCLIADGKASPSLRVMD